MNTALAKGIARTSRRNSAVRADRKRRRLTVQNLEDRTAPAVFAVDNNLDDGTAGSLRWAISQTNAAPGADQIVFDANVFAVPQTIALLSPLPAIANGDLTLFNSTGPTNAIVRRSASASSNFGIFSIDGSSPNVTFDGIGITGGNAGPGSAIANSATSDLTVRNSIVSENTGGKGAIHMPSGATGLLTIQRTTISGNTGTTGGVYFHSGGSLLVTDSTISGNTGTGTGTYHAGGILFFGTVGSDGLTIENSTIDGNTSASSGGGGGINFRNASGSAVIRNSSITRNSAPTNASGGGGVGVSGGYLNLSISSTVIAQNTGPATGRDLRITAGSATAANSLIGVIPPANFSGSGNLTGTSGAPLDPQLGDLQDNGGPTFTREPNAGSPLLNVGANPHDLFSDQRGLGHRRVYDGATDIGAVERQPVGVPFALASTHDIGSDEAGETEYTFEVAFADPAGTNNGIDVATIIGNDNAVRVTGPNSFSQPAEFVSIDVASNGAPRTAVYRIVPPGGAWNNFDTGGFTVHLEGNQVFDVDGTPAPGEPIGSFTVIIPPFVVTNADDSGGGSLRAAMTMANEIPGDDFITFDPSFFNVQREIDLASPLPVISWEGGLTITGPGADLLTLDAGGAFQGLVSNAPTLNLSGFTITGGFANETNGGGLFAIGNVTLDRMVFTDNEAVGGFWIFTGNGGGIAIVNGGFLTIRNSTVTGNKAGSNGGGIAVTYGGSLVVENTTVSGNSTSFPGNPSGYYGNYIGYYGGGGILFNGVISNAPPEGFTPGAIVIRNSTVADNHTTGSGGGIDMHTYFGTLVLENSTVSGNTADASGFSWFGYPYGGGGIKRISLNGEMSIVNSVVAGNTNASSPDIGSNGLVEVNFSAIGNTTGFTPTGANNILNADPMLGPLQNNGGPTLTMAPLPGSPLIEAGWNDLTADGMISDQRGFGFYRVFDSDVDIGAVEAQPLGIPFVAASLPEIAPGGSSYEFSVIYADPNGSNNGIDVSTVIDNDNAIRITGPFGFDVTATFESIDNPTDGTPRTVTYSFTPPGGSWNNLDNGVYSFQMQPNQIADVDGNFAPPIPLGKRVVVIPPIVVSNANDSGDGSLRSAILLANLNPAEDFIAFDPGFFNTHQEIHLASPLPTFSSDGGAVNVTGPGSALLTVDGGGNYRVFDSEAPKLTMSDLTVSGGLADGSANLPNGEFGGGLRASGTVILDHMVFTGNSAIGNSYFDVGSGGAIGMASGGFLKVANSTIAGNSAEAKGGGIFFRRGGALVIENSTISGNSSTPEGQFYGLYGGGGIFFLFLATVDVPAGFVPNTMVIRNSTIAGNTTTGSGGGVAGLLFNGTLLVQNSTISGNNADALGLNYFGTPNGGGGISIQYSYYSAAITLQNSIVSGNTNRDAPDIQSRYLVNANYSAIGSPNGFALSESSGNNLIGANLNLGPLQDNGGATQTMALGAGSSAIDAGSDIWTPEGLISDQRGFGYYRSYNSGTDIGAFESQPAGGPFVFADIPDIVPGADTYKFTVTYADPLGANNGIDVSKVIGNDDAVRVVGPGGIDLPATFISIDDSTNGTPRTVTYSITPPGGTWSNYDNGHYEVRMQPNQVADLDGNFAPLTSIGRFDVIIPPFVVLNANDSGDGSLRAAIALANSLPGDDFIAFDPGFFSTQQTINLLTPLPLISAAAGGLTITGPGTDLLTLDAGGAFRVLDSEAPTLNLSGFTVTGGLVVDDNGGGLRASGIVTLDFMVVTDNEATGDTDDFNGFGGGVAMMDFGFLTVRNSSISGNTAGVFGGGIGFYYGGSLVVENSTISGNRSTPNGSFVGYYGGGGISFYGSVASYNLPTGFTPGVLVIRNSTLVGNSTTGSGGAFLGVDIDDSLLVQNSTITGNSAAANGSNYDDYPFGGGGVAILYSGDVTVQNSVISGNNNANAPDVLTQYGVVDSSFSLIGKTNGFTEVNGSGNLLPGTDPQLGPLQNNGGPTPTRAPLPGSPLLNAGSNSFISDANSDQRGAPYVRVFGTAVDIGSVEIQPGGVTIEQSQTLADPTNGSTVSFTARFNSAVTGFDGTDIDFTGSTVGGTLVANVSGSGSDYTVTVTGMTGEGTVVVRIPAGAATDLFGSANAASTSVDNVVTFDSVAPSVTIDQAIGQPDPAVAGPIAFAVHFSEPVNGFDAGDIDFAGSTVGGTLSASVAGSGADYIVTVTGMTGEGLVVAAIPAAAASDLAGNSSAASTTSDNSVVFDGVLPTVTINQAAAQADPTNIASIIFDVTFSESVTGFDASDVSLVGSTAGGALVATVAGSGSVYTVTVTGMTSRGLVVASIPAGAAVDIAGNLNLASTGTDNSVEFVKSGIVSFDSAIYSVDDEAGVIHVTVSRTGGDEGDVSFRLATADGTAHSGGPEAMGQADYTPRDTTFTWADGESGDKTFDIPILSDTLNEGRESFALALTQLAGFTPLGITAAEASIAPSDGQGPGKYIDSDGDKYTIKLNGKTGSLLYFRTDPDGDGKGPIERIELNGTLPDPLKPKASLVISVAKSKTSTDGGTVDLGTITGPGLKSISARKADLTGGGIILNGYLASLTIGNIESEADVQTLATTNPKQKTKINSLAIGDGTTIDVGAHVSSLTATSFGAGLLKAPSVGVMTIKGDMRADIEISGLGVDPKKNSLATLKVKGAVSGSDIFVNGNVGAVNVGAFRDSRLFASYCGPDNGTGTFNFPAAVTTFKAVGKTDAFQNSRVIAGTLKSVSLTSLDSTNASAKFGFYADTSLGKIRVAGPSKFQYDPADPSPQGQDDFEVMIV